MSSPDISMVLQIPYTISGTEIGMVIHIPYALFGTDTGMVLPGGRMPSPTPVGPSSMQCIRGPGGEYRTSRRKVVADGLSCA
eukprot:227094-Rhodomonas_salina.1